ncbi:hypothetical protein BJX99DRAFT_243412 [Aspergillus californicus]
MPPLSLAGILSLGLLSKFTAATTRPCINLDLSIAVTANTSIYDIPQVNNNIDAVDFIWDIERWTAPTPEDRVTGVRTVDETFSISAQLCVPQNSEKRGILQIATHGFGFEKRYWDSAVHPEKYSYVNAALNAGYSILTYDRLGVGESSKPDGYEIVQGAVEVEILKEITNLARSGDLGLFASSALFSSQRHNTTVGRQEMKIPSFDKIVLVGHSLGSGITLAVLAEYGDIADVAIATGLILEGKFGQVGQSSFGLEYAAANDKKFHDRGSGYLVQGTRSSLQQIFFKKGFFEPEMLEYAETIKETGTVGEFVSLGGLLGGSAEGYTGALLFALGEYDFAVCAGNCTESYDLDAIKANVFPNATDVDVHIQPGSGHALTMHSNATGHFEAIFGYLGENGL